MVRRLLQTLDLHYACRLYNHSLNQTCSSRILRFFLFFVPIDQSIHFHKLVANMIVFSAGGHTFFHFVNYAKAPTPTIDAFGIWPWISGGLIMLFMFMIFS